MQCLQTTDLPLTPRRLSLALQARDWVLAISMDQSVAQELSQRSCTQCGVDTYEGAVVCHACRKPAETCAITGGSQAATFAAHPAMRPGCAVTGDLKLHGCFTAHPAQSPGCAITDGSTLFYLLSVCSQSLALWPGDQTGMTTCNTSTGCAL